MAVANEHKLKTVISAELDLKNASNAITQIEKINETSKKTAESLKQIEKAMQNIGKSKNNNSTKSASQSWLTQQQQMYKSGLQSYDQYAKQVRQKERQLYAELLNVRKTYGDNSKEFKQKLSEHQSYAKQVQQIEKQITSQMNAEAKARASYNQKELNSTISQYKKLNAEVQKMSTSSKGIFSGNIFNSMLSYGVISQVTSAFQDLGRAIVDINYNTINNQRLMGNWTKSLRDNLNSSAIEIAKTTGIQVTDAQQIQGAWVRINDSYAKNADLLGNISQLTAEFMNVGEIEDADSAVTLLNASLLQLGDTTRNTADVAEEFLNKWAYMADKTAMGTADEYGTAIARYGAQLKALGGDMDDAIVQSSILADTLAMNGNEAGTALKTFNTYLTRDKTVSLMNDIAESTGDVSFKLADANGQLKEYDELIRTVARAYQMYKDQGNDLMANKVLDSVGATRRRDVAMAMLNSVNNGSMDKYYGLLNNEETGSYLEEQNAALMGALKNQWNALIVSMQQAGMELGNAGILDGITTLVQGVQVAFEAFSNLPEPMQEFAANLIMVGTAAASLKKLGEVTGIADKLRTSMTAGSKTSIKYASEVSKVTQGFVDSTKYSMQSVEPMYKLTDSYNQAQVATKNYVSGLSDLNEAYINGRISADEYSSKTKELTSNYQGQISEIKKVAQANVEEAQNRLNSAKTVDEEKEAKKQLENANRELEAAEKLETQTTKQASNADKEYANIQKSGISSIKQKISAIKQSISQKKADIIASKTQDSAEKASLFTRASATVKAVAYTAAEKAATVAKTVGAVATRTLTAAMDMLLSPLTLITAGISVLTYLFGANAREAEANAERLETYKSRLSEVQSAIQELQQAEEERSLTADETSRLEALQQEEKQLQKLIDLQEQLTTDDTFLNHQGGFLGIGGEDSGVEKIDKLIDDYTRKRDAYIEAQRNFDNVYSKSFESDSEQYQKHLTDLLNFQSDYVMQASSILQEYENLKKMTDNDLSNGEYTGEAKNVAFDKLDVLSALYGEAQQAIADYANATGQSFDNASAAVQAYEDDLESLNDTINGLNSQKSVIDELISSNGADSTKLTAEQALELINTNSELAASLTKTADGYELNTTLGQLQQQTQESLTQSTEEAVDKQIEFNKQLENANNDIPKMITQLNNLEDVIRATGTASGDTAYDEIVKSLDESYDTVREKIRAVQELGEEPIKIRLDMSESGIDTTIDNIKSKIQEVKDNNDLTPEVQTAQVDYLNSLLDMSIQKKIQLTQPSFMRIDSSQVDTDLQDALSKLQAYQQAVNELQTLKLKGADDTEISNAQAKVDNLKQSLANIPPAKIGLEADASVDDIIAAIESNTITIPTKYDIPDTSSVDSYHPQDKTATVTYEKDTSQPDSYQPKDKEATVKYDKDSKQPDNYKPKDKSATAKYTVNSKNVDDWIPPNKTATLTYNIKTKGTAGANGTAHVNGTINGRAYASGNWGIKKDQTALVGELGQEIVVRNGRWFSVGDKGAEFTQLKRGDIVFNHLQAEQLLKKGYVTANGGRGKAYANGTVSGNAFASGYTSSYKITDDKDVAATIAVKKAAEAAIKAAQAAEAAGENVSDALKEAAENAEKVAKNIEDITSKFINNVEDLQKRIADALKKQYQEEYDAREKLLKKEHEDKLDAIQKEIDALNGDRPEDKQAELEKLKSDLAKWQGDNSTLGKAKQKEYMDKIAELEKEIKIDELEKQLEDENERYENSLDSESDGYDSVLAGLDDKMSEENLYTQANEMIKNQQKEQIEALLNKYDQHWDGWATLMGKTAGQIIAEEVGYALNNYKDVTGGTITDKGGHYSDGASLPNSGGGGSSTPPAPSRQIGVGTQVNMGNAPIYGQIGGAGYPQYFSNDPVYTVLQVNGDWLLTRWHGLGSGYTGWFRRSDVKSFDTGGYTGLDEGMAMLHAKERVLTAQQTAAFDKLVYNILPKLDKELMTTNLGESTVINNNGNTFNKELVSVNVDKIINNTPFDINNTEDNLDRMFRNSLKKSGINIKK